MRIIQIGRSSKNDIVINDNTVSKIHCQIIEDENGNYSIKDLNSLNGVYVNGMRRSGQTPINRNDIIRIGNTTLPWTQYFGPIIYRNSEDKIVYPSSPSKDVSALGIIALILAIVGAGLAIWFAVEFFNFIGDYNDIKDIYGKAMTNVGLDVLKNLGIDVLNTTVGIIALCTNIGAVILASIANITEDDNTDTTLATIANGIAGFAACVVAVMLIYFWVL